MITIWKFPVWPGMAPLVIEMPRGARVLTVQSQNERPCLWALVDSEAPKEERHFIVRGTGHDCADNRGMLLPYIGTFQLDGGRLVFHVFELPQGALA